MHPPCEMMVDTFLPSMRALVAKRLKEEGLSQGKIASLLGVTQASVSSYLSASAGRYVTGLSALGVSTEQATTFACLLAEDLKANPTYAVATLYSIWNKLLGGGAACASHRREYPFLATCDVCLRVFGPDRQASSGAVEHLEDALRPIEGSSLFVHVMPEISVNVAYAPPGAASPDDVVAIPGRIVKVRGQARSFMRPEFGSSTHLATILLEVSRIYPEVRSAMNLRFDDRMAKVLRRLGVEFLQIGPEYPADTGDKVLGAIRSKLRPRGRPERLGAVVDVGGTGVEPTTYLFAQDPVLVVTMALKIARSYAGSG